MMVLFLAPHIYIDWLLDWTSKGNYHYRNYTMSIGNHKCFLLLHGQFKLTLNPYYKIFGILELFHVKRSILTWFQSHIAMNRERFVQCGVNWPINLSNNSNFAGGMRLRYIQSRALENWTLGCLGLDIFERNYKSHPYFPSAVLFL